MRKPVAGPAADTEKPGVSPFVVGAGAASAGPAGGLTPEDLASAYGYTPAAGGSGETVGIVDAFDDPAIASDLAVFDDEYGLASCTTSNGCLTKVGQSGGATPAADTLGWSVEIALDVETVHATCPNCHILLVESDNNSEANLATAADEAVALGASVVSNSYGGPERFAGAFERSAYDHPGVPIVASTGDNGYYNWRELEEESQMPNAPASSPSVISVGGTTLTLNPGGTRANETVWPGSGGGCSKLFEARPWQLGVAGYGASGCGDKRLSADVSADADPNTGLDIYDTYDCGPKCEGVDEGWETIGGTSLSAPFIASMYALAGGGHGVPYPSVTLYGHGAHFDVTEGGNGLCEGEALGCAGIDSIGLGRIDCEGTTECDAAPGYDGPSGVGTPVGLGLFQPELPTATISAPTSPVAGSAASFNASDSASFYPGDSIASASWSWGDGTSGDGIATTHTYAAPGTYTLELTVTDAFGLSSAEATREVTVAPAVVGVEGGGGGTGGGGGGGTGGSGAGGSSGSESGAGASGGGGV
ncbi:MAG TPA: PKD domain-containing protein, partial [Solirubrobacteraceae bacterium]|nr:PKD domain-containing protein [Solirubrobacteraceae bacterium]